MQIHFKYFVILLLSVSLSACTVSESNEQKLDPGEIAKASGFETAYNAKSEVVRISIPRHDLHTLVNGVEVTPSLGATAWAAFTGTKQHTILIGEVPLLADEVNGFLASALDAGLVVTALHNTFLWDEPRVMSLHFTCTGVEDQLATAMGALLHKLLKHEIPVERPKQMKIDTSKSALTLSTIHRLLWKGEMIDGAYHISTGRGTELSGELVGDSMGVNSWAEFAGSDQAAVVNGDIALLEYELKDVLKALIASHLYVVSVHTHLAQEKPKIMFVHYWGVGSLESLAQGVHAALYVEKNFRGSQ